jgi:hypothetical protein
MSSEDTSSSSSWSYFDDIENLIPTKDNEIEKIEDFNKMIDYPHGKNKVQDISSIVKIKINPVVEEIIKINKQMIAENVKNLYDKLIYFISRNNNPSVEQIRNAEIRFIESIEKDILFNVLCEVEEKLGQSGYWPPFGNIKAIRVPILDYDGFIRAGGVVYKNDEYNSVFSGYPTPTPYTVISVGLFTMTVTKKN